MTHLLSAHLSNRSVQSARIGLLLLLWPAFLQAAEITSPTENSAQVGTYYRYFITADNKPTVFSATGLPSGLLLNETTGEISGTPKAAGSFTIPVKAGSADAAAAASLTLTVYPEHPTTSTTVMRLSDKVPPECPYGYVESLPKSYNTGSTETHPLLVDLHGLAKPLMPGDNTNNKLWNMGRTLRHIDEKYEAIALAPETPVWWNAEMLHAFFAYVYSHYRVDRSRVYLVGGSMGGGGTWDYVKKYGEEIAACIPNSGASTPAFGDGAKFVGVPTWAMHNWDDVTVKLRRLDENTNTYIPASSLAWCNEIARAWSGKPSDLLANYPGDKDPPQGKPAPIPMTATYDPHTGWRWFDGFTMEGDNNLRFTLGITGGHKAFPPVEWPKMYQWLFSQRKGQDQRAHKAE